MGSPAILPPDTVTCCAMAAGSCSIIKIPSKVLCEKTAILYAPEIFSSDADDEFVRECDTEN
jgi:hypothetical protein